METGFKLSHHHSYVLVFDYALMESKDEKYNKTKSLESRAKSHNRLIHK
jgi:hypothetical protein